MREICTSGSTRGVTLWLRSPSYSTGSVTACKHATSKPSCDRRERLWLLKYANSRDRLSTLCLRTRYPERFKSPAAVLVACTREIARTSLR